MFEEPNLKGASSKVSERSDRMITPRDEKISTEEVKQMS